MAKAMKNFKFVDLDRFKSTNLHGKMIIWGERKYIVQEKRDLFFYFNDSSNFVVFFFLFVQERI